MSPTALRLALFALVACPLFAQEPARKDEAGKAAPKALAPPSPPVVKLLEPGAEPRRPLRYRFKTGKPEGCAVEMRMSMAMELGGFQPPETKMPGTRMTMAIEPKSVSPDGDLFYEFKFGPAEVLAGPGDNAAMVASMKAMFQGLDDLAGHAVVTPRGITREADMELPPNLNPQLRQQLDSIRQSMKQFSAPFPEEPVGKGARWEVTMPIETQAIQLTQVATYTLAEIDGENGKCDIAIKQTAPPQKMNQPGLPPGASASLESMSSEGSGSMAFALAKLVPMSKMNLATSMTMSSQFQGQSQKMKMNMKVETVVSGGHPVPAGGSPAKQEAPAGKDGPAKKGAAKSEPAKK